MDSASGECFYGAGAAHLDRDVGPAGGTGLYGRHSHHAGRRGCSPSGFTERGKKVLRQGRTCLHGYGVDRAVAVGLSSLLSVRPDPELHRRLLRDRIRLHHDRGVCGFGRGGAGQGTALLAVIQPLGRRYGRARLLSGDHPGQRPQRRLYAPYSESGIAGPLCQQDGAPDARHGRDSLHHVLCAHAARHHVPAGRPDAGL